MKEKEIDLLVNHVADRIKDNCEVFISASMYKLLGRKQLLKRLNLLGLKTTVTKLTKNHDKLSVRYYIIKNKINERVN